MEDARALLDGLMGANRNTAEQGKRNARKFSDEDICKKFLLGLCPHEMFKNTKTDLGPCGKVHNDHLKELFETDKDSAWYRRKWRGPLRTQLRQMLQDVDRRIETNTVRIAEKESGGGFENEMNRDIKDEVSEQLKQAEKAADEGKFEKSRAIMKEVDATKRRLEDMESKKSEKSKKQEVVCDVCGLMVSGAEYEDIKRLGRGWHTDGKQHIGFMLIREKVKEMEDQGAKDKREGLRSPTPSPVRVQKPVSKRRSPPAGQQKTDGRRQKCGSSPKRKASPSPRRGKQDDRRKKGSRSRSRRAIGNRERSPAKGRTRGSPSPLKQSRSRYERDHPRSRSRGKKSRSKTRRSPSRGDKRNRTAKHSSPKCRSRSAARSPPKAPPDGEEKQNADGEHEAIEEKGENDESEAAAAESDVEAAEEPEPEEPEPPPEPIPPKPVRFVLGLGKLNVTSLGKR